MHSLPRILLAMYLAIWSPAVCCCGIKAVMGRVTGVEIARCGQQATGAAVDTEPTEAAGCCANREAQTIDRDLVSCHSASLPSSSNDEPSPCRCHETVESKVRLDTGAKVTLPALVKIDMLPALLPVVIVVAMEPSVAEGVDDNDHHSHAPPPRTSLLAQRCLLLI